MGAQDEYTSSLILQQFENITLALAHTFSRKPQMVWFLSMLNHLLVHLLLLIIVVAFVSIFFKWCSFLCILHCTSVVFCNLIRVNVNDLNNSFFSLISKWLNIEGCARVCVAKYYMSPKIPANVLRKFFMVSSPSTTSSPSFSPVAPLLGAPLKNTYSYFSQKQF